MTVSAQGRSGDPFAAFRGFLRKRLPDAETAEDILQENLLKALQDGEWDGKENPTAWFHRVLRNAVADFYRMRASRARREERFAAEAPPTFSGQDALGDACECFHGLLPDLKSEYAEALRAIDLEGLKPREAAASAGVSPENMNVRLHRARRALRRKLEETCGICSEHGCVDCACGH